LNWQSFDRDGVRHRRRTDRPASIGIPRQSPTKSLAKPTNRGVTLAKRPADIREGLPGLASLPKSRVAGAVSACLACPCERPPPRPLLAVCSGWIARPIWPLASVTILQVRRAISFALRPALIERRKITTGFGWANGSLPNSPTRHRSGPCSTSSLVFLMPSGPPNPLFTGRRTLDCNQSGMVVHAELKILFGLLRGLQGLMMELSFYHQFCGCDRPALANFPSRFVKE
jgi:hypothetical protein